MLDTLKENWEKILEYMKEEHEITNVSFDTWLKPLVPDSIEDNNIYVSYPGEKHGLEYIHKKRAGRVYKEIYTIPALNL